MFRILALILCSVFGSVLTAEAARSCGAAMEIEINGRTFAAVLEDNETAKAFAGLLPLALDMSELNGNEKYRYLTRPLPSASENVRQIRAGDIMLYGDDCVVVFYKDFATSYRYTRIGRVDGGAELEDALGKGGVTVKFSK